MRRISSRSFHVHVLLIVFAFFPMAGLTADAQQQPLGDIARENRDKQAADAATNPPKVFTNASLPKDATPDAGASAAATAEDKQPTSPASTETSRRAAAQRAAEQRFAERRSEDQWRRRILAQESTVASLRLRVDRLKASIHFVDPYYYPSDSSGYYAENRYQARQLQRLQQLQAQLSEQRRKLEDLQEAARRAGMHTAVYDP